MWVFQSFIIRNIFNMQKSLHFFLFVLSFILFFSISKAQSDRVQFARTESPVPVQSTQINETSPEKRIEKELHPSAKKGDSLIGLNTTTSFVNKSTDPKYPGQSNVRKSTTERRVKVTRETTDNVNNIDAPLNPDFQVTAIKEQSYDDTKPSKEITSTQLVKRDRVPQDDFQSSNTTIPQGRVTLSPLKRKYLEGVVTELEQEIKNGKKLSTETQAKKKELDDLKKLLAE